jgi:hypothetical protein
MSTGGRREAAAGASGNAATAFLDALTRRDFDRVALTLTPDVRFRALVPSGVREADTAAGATTWLSTWFGTSDSFEVLGSGVEGLAGRQRLWYRFGLEREGRPTVIQQEGFCDLSADRITDLSLVCSGFQPADPGA